MTAPDTARRVTDGWADISANGLYRYTLGRRWDVWKPFVCWIMLNPSTADALTDDLTIVKCRRFSADLGGGGLVAVNLFAYRATQPADLVDAAEAGIDVVGSDNDKAIRDAVNRSTIVIAAWGVHGDLYGRAAAVARLIGPKRFLHRLGPTTKHGYPRHPSRLAYAAPLQAHL